MVKFSPFLLDNKNIFDLIVFDIDGVLLDISHSFPLAIARAVAHYGKINGFPQWHEPALADVSAFKTISGFNNDWDLAEAMLVYQLQRELLDQPLDLPEFLRQIDQLNGGLTGIRSWLKQLPPLAGNQLQQAYRVELIRHLGMEYYAGSEYYQALYGFSPEFAIDIGTMQTEISLIDVGLLTRLSHQKGIYSGRNKREFKIALDKIRYPDWQADLLVCDDGVGPTKPDSKPLWQMMTKSQTKGLIFVGDARDDQTTVENFRKNYPGISAEFVQILDDRQPFNHNFSYVEKVNQLLEFLLAD